MLLLPHLWDQIWKVAEKAWITVGYQIIPSCSGEGSHPTWNDSYIHSKIYKVIVKHYMLWMGIWSPHHAVTTTLVGPDLESQL